MRSLERLLYRITLVDPSVEMTGKQYATCFVFFGFFGTLLLYGILRLQQFLPWFFPQYHTTPLSADLALNTAISFSTTTTWQAHAGENTTSSCGFSSHAHFYNTFRQIAGVTPSEYQRNHSPNIQKGYSLASPSYGRSLLCE